MIESANFQMLNACAGQAQLCASRAGHFALILLVFTHAMLHHYQRSSRPFPEGCLHGYEETGAANMQYSSASAGKAAFGLGPCVCGAWGQDCS